MKEENESDEIIKELKKRIDLFIDNFGLLNIFNKTSQIITDYNFDGLEDQSIIKIKIRLKILGHVHEALYFHKKLIIKDARPIKDGPMEIMMPVYYDIMKLIDYLADMDKWGNLFELIFAELKKEGTINQFERDYLIGRVKEIIQDEFKLAIDNKILIPKDELDDLYNLYN